MDNENQHSTCNSQHCPLAPTWIVSLDLETAEGLAQWRERLESLADAQVRGVIVEFFRCGFPVFRSQAATEVWGRRAKRYLRSSFESLCEAALELDFQVVGFSRLLDAGSGQAPLSREIVKWRRSTWAIEQSTRGSDLPDEAGTRFWWNISIAEVRQYIASVIAELVVQYPVDAVFLQHAVLPENLLPTEQNPSLAILPRSDEHDEELEGKTAGEMQAPPASPEPIQFYRALRAAAHRGALPIPLLLDSRDWRMLSNQTSKITSYFDGIVVGAQDLVGQHATLQVPDTAQLWVDARTKEENWDKIVAMAANESFGALMVITDREQRKKGVAFFGRSVVAEVGDVLSDPQAAFAVVCSCFEYLAQVTNFEDKEAAELLSVLFNAQKSFSVRTEAQEELVNLLRGSLSEATTKSLDVSVVSLVRRLLRVIGSYPIIPPVAHAIPMQT